MSVRAERPSAPEPAARLPEQGGGEGEADAEVPAPDEGLSTAGASGDGEIDSAPSARTKAGGGLTLLVIEDDPHGAVRIPAVTDAAGREARVRTARNLTEAARLLTDDVHCILLDLELPAVRGESEDSPAAEPGELDVLHRVLDLAPGHAVLALTGGADLELGAEAVRVGAQDYLVRDELDGRLLSRAVRYAVERKRGDLAQRQLTESRLRAQENARLERGLLPRPLLDGSDLRFAARYRPGRSRALLGGDFYDTVRTADGTVHAMIGDVCGHGPDEAALGVELRIAWRTLTFAGICGDELLGTLQRVLEHERASDEIFATLCTVDIAPDGRSAGVCLAGHPPPLLSGGDAPPRLLTHQEGGPALGLLAEARWPRGEVELGGEWSLMMYTDGLVEGRTGNGGRERLGEDGMLELIEHQLEAGACGEDLLDGAMADVRRLNGGELTDDVAVLLLDRA
ncbi:PP2C family protein-serine/threonine phosphatase [Streptomyces sulphureus]|uniref:PP2C family protein-serine/threonine phosphatase n=1 Tax=Streptomyces sulphureus TaxID=47758 RepID=UPI00036B5DD2|nr:fused response regulator/phosphatase [Streptomyces sulphureus]